MSDFLAPKIIAAAGVSRDGDLPANLISRKLRTAGYEVFPVNPKARDVEEAECFPDLASVPAEIQGLVIATAPAAAESLLEECIRWVL